MQREFAFPPVEVNGSLEHVFCWADDSLEFLASAKAWLVLQELASDEDQSSEAIWSAVQDEHTRSLARADDPMWREELENELETTLFTLPRYYDYWCSLKRAGVSPRVQH